MSSSKGRANWPRVPLRELVDERGISYGVVQPGRAQSDGVPLIRVNNITASGLQLGDVMTIDPAIADRYDRSRLRGGEVLVTLVGSVGNVATVPEELAGWNIARAVGIVPVRDGISAKWVEWCLQTPDAQRYFAAHVNTTVQKTLNLRDLAAIEIPMPDGAALQAISDVLGSLDEKIASNRRLAALLEGSAATEFSARFEHFVGVTHFEETDLGSIPAEWRLMKLDELADINARSHKKQTHPDFVSYVDITSVSHRSVDAIARLKYEEAPSRARRIVHGGDTIVSTVRPERRSLAFIHEAEPDLTASTGFAVLSPTIGSPTFVYRSATSDACTGHLSRCAAGSAYPAVNPRVLADWRVAVPPDMGRSFEELSRPLEAKRWALARETLTISAVREALLPRLLTGNLQVQDPEIEALLA